MSSRARPPRRRHREEPEPPAANVYGRNPVRETLRGRRAVRKVWATSSAAGEPWLEGVPVQLADSGEIAALCGSDAHQGICALADPYPYVDSAQLLGEPDPVIIVLDEIEDPQNLGAIARTAECVGATGIVIPERRSAEVTAAVCKASSGAVEHLRIARVRNLADFLADAKAAGCWCYGAAMEGAVPYTEPDFSGGTVLVMGAEGKGLRPRVAAACDQLVYLPLRGRIESLNVSATAAVLMYRILQRRLDGST
jgi:23S rRNA (guanosine2251-2'-O)-methyltransferase